jgi:hypothetical protein
MRKSVTLMMIEADCAPNRVCVQELAGLNGNIVTITYSAKTEEWWLSVNNLPHPLKINLAAADQLIAEVGNEA